MMHEITRNLESMLVISCICGLAKQNVLVYTLKFPIYNLKIKLTFINCNLGTSVFKNLSYI